MLSMLPSRASRVMSPPWVSNPTTRATPVVVYQILTFTAAGSLFIPERTGIPSILQDPCTDQE